MLTFKQFIAEAQYFGGSRIQHWGVIHPKGHVVSGQDKTGVTHHDALIHHEIKKSGGKEHTKQFVHYAGGHNELNIGGSADHKTVHNTLKNWSKLPHSPSGHVNLDLHHSDPHYRIMTSGPHKKVYGELRKHAEKFEG